MNEKKPEPTNPEITPAAAVSQFSRREMLQCASYGAALMLLTAAQEQAAADAPHKGVPQTGFQGRGPRKPLLQGTTDGVKQQFPYFADAPWDKPQYYETIQAGRRMFPKTYQMADIDGDGRDEMIARGPGGLHVNKYNPDTGQWVPMADGPPWRDAITWDQPEYYQTILCADIDGDGKAELIGRGGQGIEVYKYDTSSDPPKWIPLIVGGIWNDADDGWNHPQYYSTIQSAILLKPGDPGYTGGGTFPQAVLIGRGGQGIEVYTYDVANNKLILIGQFLSAWSDTNGWNQPQYYQTIQCADVDGDGYDELIGRSPNGIVIYRWDKTSQPQQWRPFLAPLDPDSTNLTLWNDGRGWDQPQYYQTIQCADIDGDGQAELIGRDKSGIEIYKYNKSNTTWENMSAPKFWPNGIHWDQPQYYQTIQCADIDGDGCAELIGRGGIGLEAYKYNPITNTWLTSIPFLTAWTDANGWNQVQHYATIQSARVLKPGDPGYIGSNGHIQAVIMGRGSLSMQTFRLISPTQGWVQTSAPPPVFTPAQQAAYPALGTSLGNSAARDIRAHYNNKAFLGPTGNFIRWQTKLYHDPPDSYEQQSRPHSSLAPPAGVTQEDWDIVTWQIYWELQWVQAVYDWYGPGKMGGLIDRNTIAQMLTLQDVGNYMSISSDSSLEILFTILALIASAAAAILTGGASVAVEGAATLGIASAVAGGVAGAFGAVPDLLPGGGGAFQEAYNQLQEQIDKGFTQAIRGNEILLFGLTGGTAGNTYYPLDYGRLKQIGEWIGDGTWQWDTGPDGGTATDYLLASARGYAVYVWKTLLTAQPWYVWRKEGEPPPDGFPPQYSYFGDWLCTSSFFFNHFVPTPTLAALFDPIKDGQTFPLAVPLEDVYVGGNGWPPTDLSDAAPLPGSPRSSLGVDLRLSAELSRDALTGEVVATMTLRNRGATTASNVEITNAMLHGRRAVAIHVHQHMRLHTNHPQKFTVSFPNLPQGTNAVLRLSGRYLGGTFGGSFRVKLP
jgi:hypothetical protein